MAPQHSITAALVYLPIDAFDIEIVAAERERMDDSGNAHPIPMYFSGETRYDLGATATVPIADCVLEARCPRDYIVAGHQHPEWTGRRIRPLDVTRCRDIGGATGQLEALRLGLRSVRGPDLSLTLAEGRTLTEAQVEQLVDAVGIAALLDVGEAFLRASSSAKAAEKKA